MDHEVGPWKMTFFNSSIAQKLSFESLGPSPGVNRMWTTRNDHGPKKECVDFLNICTKRVVFLKK